MRFIYTKTFAAFAVCVAIVALLALLEARGWIDPIKQVFLQAPRPVVGLSQSLARPVKTFFFTIYNLRQITRDNAALKSQLADLRRQAADFDEQKRENEALRKELGFVGTVKFGLVPCTVLSENPLGLTGTLVLNCGSDRGVMAGQGVLSQGYLVGKVVYAGKNSSTALLATDSKFSADAQLAKTGSLGLVTGSFGSGLLLDRLSQNEPVEPGWLAVTAGINGQIPKSILIGQVGDIISASGDLFKKATLLTPVDFDNLSFVFVAKP